MRDYIPFPEYQKIAKNILRQVAEFCDANGLTYFLTFGTLIGAVRHKDIIPWDYDIDIIMPRPDFNRFLELVREHPVADNLTVYSWENERNYYAPFIKVCDNRTRLVITKTKRTKIPLGIWIDIFPLDGGSDSMEENQKMQQDGRVNIHKAIAPFCATESFKQTLLQLPSVIRSWFIPSKKYIQKAMQIASRYDYASAKQVGWVISVDVNISKELVDKELYTPIRVPFGDFEACIPAGYDTILTQLYGDYMTPPPVQQQTIPTIKAYWIDR